jgi:four helix bundle protein
LVRSGTSSPPNYDESCAAESRDDFVHKLSIALKELKETRGWLRFIPLAGLLPEHKVKALLVECEELVKILGKSVSTAKTKGRRPPSAI